MAKDQISTKRVAISKANAQMVAIVAVACFISIFCLFASKTVLDHNSYKAKVVSEKQKAHNQLIKNVKAFNSLKQSYVAFDAASPNALEQDKDGTGDNNGSNSKIVLDALPSTYDFPALASSIEKMMNDRGLTIGNLSGTDDQLNQQANTSSSSPTAVPIPFSFSINNANYDSVKKVIAATQHSIRPIVIDTMNISGSNDSMTVTVTAHTFYQPAKNLNILKKVVK